MARYALRFDDELYALEALASSKFATQVIAIEHWFFTIFEVENQDAEYDVILAATDEDCTIFTVHLDTAVKDDPFHAAVGIRFAAVEFDTQEAVIADVSSVSGLSFSVYRFAHEDNTSKYYRFTYAQPAGSYVACEVRYRKGDLESMLRASIAIAKERKIKRR